MLKLQKTCLQSLKVSQIFFKKFIIGDRSLVYVSFSRMKCPVFALEVTSVCTWERVKSRSGLKAINTFCGKGRLSCRYCSFRGDLNKLFTWLKDATVGKWWRVASSWQCACPYFTSLAENLFKYWNTQVRYASSPDLIFYNIWNFQS